MNTTRAAGALVLVSFLLLAFAAAGDTPASPEASMEQIQAVTRAMGNETDTVEAGTGTGTETDNNGFGALIARVVGVLVFILGLLYVSLLGMKKVVAKNQTAVGGEIRVLGRTPLSPKANVYLLRFKDRYLIVGEAGERLTSLASMAAEEAPEIEEEGADIPVSGGLEGIFSVASGEERQDAESRPAMVRVGEGVKKLRQDTENLLKIHLGVSGSGAGHS